MPKSKTPLEEALEKLSASRPTPVAKTKTKALPTPQLTLPLWPESVRAIPNAVLRGALFSVSQRRATAKNLTLLTTVEGLEIRFKGERFNQVDLDLLEMLLHLARLQPLGHKVEFSSHALLKELGRGTSGKEHEDLQNGIARLAGGVVDIKWTTGEHKNKTVGGTLVSAYGRDDNTGRNVVIFNEKLIELYDNGYTHIVWEQRKALKNNSLAKWLHGFFASHAEPYPYKVQSLKDLCGSTVERLSDFRKMLKAAFTILCEVKAIAAWEIDESDLVHVKTNPSQSQKRHILKKSTARTLTRNQK